MRETVDPYAIRSCAVLRRLLQHLCESKMFAIDIGEHFVAMLNVYIHYSFSSIKFCESLIGVVLAMIDENCKILTSFRIYLLLILMTRSERILTLSDSYSISMDNKQIGNMLPLISNENHVQTKRSLGKDRLNAAHLRRTRKGMVEIVVIVGVGLVILVGLGGTIGIIIYYAKK
ncbi:unnamed protein product [Adineta ricciae]|uniref:Uncharacterized protein n=1 Tax=Adineta ricciae TaxID=249248 RepID=A0A814MJH8_ADIRI|nr:unnamed protein product [Adineta ricciae]CAF1079841.1 unnamed protein product [Adineta ricciae]